MTEERLKIAGCTVLKVIIHSDIPWSIVIYNCLTKKLKMTLEDIARTMDSIEMSERYAKDVLNKFYSAVPINLPEKTPGESVIN